MAPELTPESNEWRLYFCVIGELWQAVRDGQPEYIVLTLLDEIQALAFTTNQDLLHRQCQRVLNIARSAAYGVTGG